MSRVLISLDMYVDCPHCDHTFDLMSHDDNDEGFWTMKLRSWLNNEKGADKLNEDIECPECDKRIDLTEMEY